MNSCLAAAQANNGKIIGVDVDQSGLDSCVITSAMKALANSVKLALTDCMGNGWKWSSTYAGKESNGAEDCVGLPMDKSQFQKFTTDDYNKLFKGLVDGTVTVDNTLIRIKHRRSQMSKLIIRPERRRRKVSDAS